MVSSELGDSQGSFSYITPSSDLDIDNATLGKLLTEAHREHADYCDPEGVSVSQSSLSVVFDRTGKLVGENSSNAQIRTLLGEQRQMIIAEYCEPGLFLGYALCAGGIWKGDVLITDLEELETMDASEIYSKRLNAKEVIFHQKGEFIFPIADGRIKTPGGDQELKTSTLVRHRPIQGESNIDFKRIRRVSSTTS